MRKYKKLKETPSVLNIREEKKDSFDLINQYGTYEIQPTANTNNQYPAIAQGYNKKIVKHDCCNPQKKKK